jgi:hypothetical protein
VVKDKRRKLERADLEEHVREGEGIFDLDGRFIHADELLETRFKRTFDLKTVPPLVRTFFVIEALQRGRTRFVDPVVERLEGFRSIEEDGRQLLESEFERLKLNPRWTNRDAVVVDFLRRGGYRLVNAGSTGRAPGRQATGLRGGDLIGQRIKDLAPGFDYAAATRPERAALVLNLIDSSQPVNRQALADFWGVNKSTITRLYQLGLHQNSPKSEGDDLFAA